MSVRSLVAIAGLLVGCGRYGFSDAFSVAGDLEIDHASIDFAMACGGSSTSTMTLRDTGDKPIAFTATPDVPGVTVSPATGTLAPGGSAMIAVTATADAIGIPGAVMSGELLLSTDDPASGVTSIPLTLTTTGGVLISDLSSIDFGQVTTATAHTRSVMIENTGDATVSVTAGPFADPAFSITSPTMFDLAAGATESLDIQFVPSASQPYSTPLPLAATGATCQPMPVITAAGVGTLSTVLLDHTTIDFGAIACGTGAGTMDLTLTNSNASSYPYTATVSAGASSFTAMPASGTVPASGNATIVVGHVAAPVPTPPGSVTGNLELVVMGSGTTEVPLQYDVVGPSLSASTTSLDFGEVDHSKSIVVMITNSGNEIANVTMTRTGASEFSAPASFQIAAGATGNVTITFTPTAVPAVSADFAVSAMDECSSPFTIHVTGHGDN